MNVTQHLSWVSLNGDLGGGSIQLLHYPALISRAILDKNKCYVGFWLSGSGIGSAANSHLSWTSFLVDSLYLTCDPVLCTGGLGLFVDFCVTHEWEFLGEKLNLFNICLLANKSDYYWFGNNNKGTDLALSSQNEVGRVHTQWESQMMRRT